MSTAFNGAQPEIKVFDNSEVKKPREPAEKKHCRCGTLENEGTQLPYSHMAFGWESNLGPQCRECGERERPWAVCISHPFPHLYIIFRSIFKLK